VISSEWDVPIIPGDSPEANGCTNGEDQGFYTFQIFIFTGDESGKAGCQGLIEPPCSTLRQFVFYSLRTATEDWSIRWSSQIAVGPEQTPACRSPRADYFAG